MTDADQNRPSVPVRVRFAPSPTGIFHVGGARTALFNWAIAQRSGGRFVLRVEDTDASRNRPEWTQGILDALTWLGIDTGSARFEGPYFQSALRSRHRAAAETLHASGQAYYCDCTREALAERTGSPQLGYDGFCRERGLTAGHGRALRFRTPDDGVIVVNDLIRGPVEFIAASMEDFVVARGDGSPLFVLANVVDDSEMAITHVVRGEEHLSNTPKQQALWSALGMTPPVWAHVPVIVNEQRQKLSKRRDKVALETYRAEGYLPEAMVNYLMLLGWGPGDDREILPWSQIVTLFRLSDVNSAPAFFDEQKLRAFNGEYIRGVSVDEFVDRCRPWLERPHAPWPPENLDLDRFAAVAPLAQTRVAVLSEIVPNVDFLFLDEPVYDEASWSKAMKPGAAEILADAMGAFTDCAWEAAALKDVVERVGAAHGLKLGKAQAPVRVAVTGRTVGLPLFESLEVLGREPVLRRLRTALGRVTGAG